MMNHNVENLEHKIQKQSGQQITLNGSHNQHRDKVQLINGQQPNGKMDHQVEKELNGTIMKNDSNKNMQSLKSAQPTENQLPPVQTFQNVPFNELMTQYECIGQKVQPTSELTQAMLMTTNFKEAAGILNGMQIATEGSTNQLGSTGLSSNQNHVDKIASGGQEGLSTGTSYFFRADCMSDLMKKCSTKDLNQVNKLLTNIGTSDKASNILLEQRNVQRAQATDGRDMRELIQNKIVDQNEYIRMKENIAQAKQRVKEHLDNNDDQLSESSDCLNQNNDKQPFTDQIFKSKINGYTSANNSSETQDDSGQGKNSYQKAFDDNKINKVINHIRKCGQEYLGCKDGRNYEKVPLSTICQKLRKDNEYIKRRDFKFQSKDGQTIQHTKEQLMNELKTMNENLQINEKDKILKKIESIESIMGLEKRLKSDHMDQTIAEIDLKPMTSQAFDIQNVLFDYCGINITNQFRDDQDFSNDTFSNQKRIEKLFGKIRRLPKKSCLLNNFFEKQYEIEHKRHEIPKKENQELVKIIGLEPDKLFEKIGKYKVQISKMPKFSNVFDSIDSIMPGGLSNKQSIPGQNIINPITSQMSFQRIDGRQVISLQFNPFFIGSDVEKKKIYDNYMREILEQRDKIKNAPKEAKNKQETQNIKRAWQNIVKKDIPKAFRMYQKFKADQESNNKKMSQNCLKEVRKRAVKTQRLAKESVMRARKLTKEMCQYWRRRDKELADGKRKREKLDKELKKRQQEEEEALLQKKRLEYLMKQSEIYAHFMAAKLGVSDDHKQKEEELQVKQIKRVDVDQRAARIHIAGMINENRKRLDEFDDHDREEVNEDDLDDQKFNNPLSLNRKVQPPDIFVGELKKYQLKGLQWLDNLYDQGINGILADEMGLGKTIQAIALLAHLAEKKNVWGPYLIIVPVTTLHNWQNELQKFCPTLKVLPYFGNAEDRKKLAKFLDPKNLYNPALSIHVLITSYNLIVGGGKDQFRLQRVKWHYMILDEAQAIKNNMSRRWKTLLGFNTRNRLLLSGTPIQNSMAELWALLHFIMPKLFDNHEQFQEWFSKDIEQHSMDQGELNKHQLKRLHLILQPFMLRRLKKDVEQEIAPKVEEIVQCDMTHRQKVLYDRIKRKISAQDLFQLASSKAKVENLMNLVMQFRKVCNHPDLFERRLGKIPFVFAKMQHGVVQNMSLANKPDVIVTNQNPITFNLPKMIFDECFLLSDNNTKLFSQKRKYLDECFTTVSVNTHFSFFNIFNEQNLYNEIYNTPKKKINCWKAGFDIIGLLLSSNGWGLSEFTYLTVADKMIQTIALMHFYSKKYNKNTYMNVHNSDKKQLYKPFGTFNSIYRDKTGHISRVNSKNVDIIVNNFIQRDQSLTLYRSHVVENLDLEVPGQWVVLDPLIPENIDLFARMTLQLKKQTNIYFNKCISEPIDIYCQSINFNRYQNSMNNNPQGKKVMCGQDFKPKKDIFIGRVSREISSFLQEDGHQNIALSNQQKFNQGPPSGYSLIDQGILKYNYQVKGSCTLQLPDYSRLVTDCSKMGVLAELLERMHKGNHRCLIFCQMTRMMDILEDLLIWYKYSYFRMDGSTQLQDRRFMVEEFQNNPNVFIFILSTRAGGLGINLIAADTVIFYDNDWNPTMDSQATDRAHRIGQTKEVHVYRLVTKNTVEERILIRARQKENVQSTVYGANLKADSFSTRDVVDMIIDDIDDPLSSLGNNRNQVKGFIKGGVAGKIQKKERKKKKKKGDESANDGALYESVKHHDAHDKYENEIDDLIEESLKKDVNKEDEEAEIQEINQNMNNDKKDEASSDDDGQDDASSDNSDNDEDPQQTTLDKKKLLLKMLEKGPGGGGKQIFNFEEEDNPDGQFQKQQEQEIIEKRKQGRPPNKNGQKGPVMFLSDDRELEYDDEEMEEEGEN